jgi:hypothetical protein
VAPGSNRFLTIGAAVGSLGLLTAVVLLLWPADPTDYGFSSGREQADGETVGWVSKVESNTIHVNSGPFGGGVVPLVVTKHTKITVGAKEGWFEDIRPGGQVKVAYELYHGKRLARTVELLVDEGARRPGRGEPRLKSAVGAPATERAPTKASAASSPAPKAIEPAPPLVAVTPPKPAASVRPTVPGPPDTRPASRPEPARSLAAEVQGPPRASTTPAHSVAAPENGGRAQEAVRQPETTARPQSTPPAPPPAPARAPEPARGTEGEGADGSAAVDWLLKGRR